MTVDPEEFYRVLTAQEDISAKSRLITALKGEVKREYIDLSLSHKYFEALAQVLNNSNETSIHPVAFSCTCHLIKRVITQDPVALKVTADVALPVLINKLGDSKSSVKSTARRIFEDYWLSCPQETEAAVKSLGFFHSNASVRNECIQILHSRAQIQNYKLPFRQFTEPLVTLLTDSNQSVRQQSYQLLKNFFKAARPKAKEDLYKELRIQQIPTNVASPLLRDIDFDAPHPSEEARPRDQKIDPRPHTQELADEQVDILSVSFITDLPGYALEEISSEFVASADNLREDVSTMLPAFEGKETEFNWSLRDKHIQRLRSIVRGNSPEDFLDHLIWAFRYLSDGIVKAIASLRTTLSSGACSLIREAAIIMGSSIDAIIEPFLTNLIRLSATAKKISHTNAFLTINAMILNASYSPKFVTQIQLVMNDKIPQPKIYCATWIRALLGNGTGIQSKGYIESSGGQEILEKSIVKGLNDPNPGVREAMRLAFWSYAEIWQPQASKIFNNLEPSFKKALERANPRGSGNFGVGRTAGTSSNRLTSKTAARPPIRELISRSREANANATTNSNFSISMPSSDKKGPPGKAIRMADRAPAGNSTGLGAAQRARRPAPAPGSIVNGAQSLGTWSVPSSERKKETSTYSAPFSTPLSSITRGGVTTEPGRQLTQLNPLPEQPQFVPAPLAPRKPTLGELLESSDIEQLSRGISILIPVLKGDTVTGYEGETPPSHNISNALSRIFYDMIDDEQAKVVLRSGILAKILEYIPYHPVVVSAAKLLNGVEAVNILHDLNTVMNRKNASFIAFADSATEVTSPLVLNKIMDILETLSSDLMPTSEIVAQLERIQSNSTKVDTLVKNFARQDQEIFRSSKLFDILEDKTRAIIEETVETQESQLFGDPKPDTYVVDAINHSSATHMSIALVAQEPDVVLTRELVSPLPDVPRVVESQDVFEKTNGITVSEEGNNKSDNDVHEIVEETTEDSYSDETKGIQDTTDIELEPHVEELSEEIEFLVEEPMEDIDKTAKGLKEVTQPVFSETAHTKDEILDSEIVPSNMPENPISPSGLTAQHSLIVSSSPPLKLSIYSDPMDVDDKLGIFEDREEEVSIPADSDIQILRTMQEKRNLPNGSWNEFELRQTRSARWLKTGSTEPLNPDSFKAEFDSLLSELRLGTIDIIGLQKLTTSLLEWNDKQMTDLVEGVLNFLDVDQENAPQAEEINQGLLLLRQLIISKSAEVGLMEDKVITSLCSVANFGSTRSDSNSFDAISEGLLEICENYPDISPDSAGLIDKLLSLLDQLDKDSENDRSGTSVEALQLRMLMKATQEMEKDYMSTRKDRILTVIQTAMRSGEANIRLLSYQMAEQLAYQHGGILKREVLKHLSHGQQAMVEHQHLSRGSGTGGL